MRQPDFSEMLRVLDRKPPRRPVLFEIGTNARLVERFAEPGIEPDWGRSPASRFRMSADRNMGFDGSVVMGSGFGFPKGQRDKAKSASYSEGGLITDRAGFARYTWPDPDAFDYADLGRAELPDGMKLIVWGPGGLLENVIALMGYNALCMQLADDPALVGEVFDAIGSRLVRYYELASGYDTVGAVMVNDDWGFKSQTMLSPADMRKHVIPWHKRMVAAIHQANKPALLHSCGNLEAVMDDIIDVIGYDAKHSFEDVILPVEQAYERWGGRIAILGGMDVDFLCRSTPAAIRQRSQAMLQRTATRGGYALGSGNSVPDYVPDESFLAMTAAALEG